MSSDIHPGWGTLGTGPRQPRNQKANLAAVVPAAPPPDGDPLAGLTPVRRVVARLAAEGHTNDHIAAVLGIHTYTVKNHLTEVYRRLGIATAQRSGSRRLAYLVGHWDGRQAATGERS